MNIAVLLTCFNRKEKTLGCLQSLYNALDFYNKNSENELINLFVYLTDDGCTDGTANAILGTFSDKNIQIIQGTGSLFWAGGMRLAWNEAYKKHEKTDFYLLLNDDTDVYPNVFISLMEAYRFSLLNYSFGIYVGATCAPDDATKCTYGGHVWINKFWGTYRRLYPIGVPQSCDMANANILLVSSNVVNKIGMLSKRYQHGLADFDYAIRANKAKIPVLVTSDFCGKCCFDHMNNSEREGRIKSMTLAERKEYFNSPFHSNRDYLKFIYVTSPIRYPFVWIGRTLNLYFPKLYYGLNKIRNRMRNI